MGDAQDLHPDKDATFRTPHSVLSAAVLLILLAAGIVWSVQATRATVAWRAGERLLADGHYQAAAETLDSAVLLAPPGGAPGYSADRAALARSWAYLARRDTIRATAVLPQEATDPALAPAILLQRGLIAAAAGDSAGARAWFSTVGGSATPGGATPASRAVQRAALWHRGEIAWAQGAPEAEADFAAITGAGAPAHDPYTAAAWLRQAELWARPDPAAARQALTAARATLPVDPTLAALPDLHLTALDLDEGLPAAVLTDTIARLDADLQGVAAVQGLGDTTLDVYWGRALAALEAWPQAAALLERAIQADPTLADAHAYLGLAQERMGQAGAAEGSYRTALHLAPDRDLARHLLARLLIAQNRLDEARPLLDTVLAHNPGDVVAHLDLAGWAQAGGQYDLAEAEYKQAELTQMADESAGTETPAERELNTSLLLAGFYFVAGPVHNDCTLARDAATRAVTRHPGAAEYDALGWAQYLCGALTPAQAALRQAVAADPRLPSAQYHLGVVLKTVGNPGARAALEAAQDLDPQGLWARRAVAAIANP